MYLTWKSVHRLKVFKKVLFSLSFVFDLLMIELEVSLSSVNKAPTDKPKKDDLKNNSKIRSRIKVP